MIKHSGSLACEFSYALWQVCSSVFLILDLYTKLNICIWCWFFLCPCVPLRLAHSHTALCMHNFPRTPCKVVRLEYSMLGSNSWGVAWGTAVNAKSISTHSHIHTHSNGKVCAFSLVTGDFTALNRATMSSVPAADSIVSLSLRRDNKETGLPSSIQQEHRNTSLPHSSEWLIYRMWFTYQIFNLNVLAGSLDWCASYSFCCGTKTRTDRCKFE